MHSGSLGSGHYTAYAYNEEANAWYYFNDSHVSLVHDVDSVRTQSAYVLFYKRKESTSNVEQEQVVNTL